MVGFESSDYRLVTALLIFYGVLFFILGQLNIQTAEDLGYENANTFTGVKAMLEQGLELHNAALNALFVILFAGPLVVILLMISLDHLQGYIP